MIYIRLFLAFAKIGFFGFGGGMAMLPMIYQIAQDFGEISTDEFSNLVGISQVTPGPIAVNAATYVGYCTAGLGGAIVATLGVAVPSFVLVSLACYFINKFKESAVIKGSFVGIRPVTVGLIGAAVIFMGQSLAANISAVSLAIVAVTVVSVGKLKISPIATVIAAGVIGAILCG